MNALSIAMSVVLLAGCGGGGSDGPDPMVRLSEFETCMVPAPEGQCPADQIERQVPNLAKLRS